MLAKKLSFVLALCLLLVALVTAQFEAEGTKPVASAKGPPQGNPNNKMWRNTKPPTSKTPRPPKPHKSKTKPPSMQKPIKTPKPPKPAKPETYKKCTPKFCTDLVKSIEVVADETMQRCNATTCPVVDRWYQALRNKTINLYTPKTDKKDAAGEYCWVEFCKGGTNKVTRKVAFGRGDCSPELCPTFYSLIDWVRARYGNSAIPNPR